MRLPNWKLNTCKCVTPRPWYSRRAGVEKSRDAETGFGSRRVGIGSELTVMLSLHCGKGVTDGSVKGKGKGRPSYLLQLYSWNGS